MKIKRLHLLPSILSRTSYLHLTLLRLYLIWKLTNLPPLSKSKLMSETCSKRKYFCVDVCSCGHVLYLVKKDKVLLVLLTMCHPYQEKDLCLSPWHKSLKGQRPPKEASGFVLDTEQSIFFCQVSCLTKHGKKYPSTVTLLWLWRE